ncbi:MAG: DUF5615 family PIN-like protein [Chloroflexi bacterium]|nr:DUF5615 family PIN-like protein [Chloroflexota bacterium]
MAAPPAYLDECVDLTLTEGLRLRGFTVTAALDEGQLGRDDDEQILHATRHGWIIVSHNIRHFERWHRTFRSRDISHGGIILLPDTGPISRLTLRAAMMLDWIGQQDYRSKLFKWGDLQMVLTQSFRLPGYSEDEVRHALGQQ